MKALRDNLARVCVGLLAFMVHVLGSMVAVVYALFLLPVPGWISALPGVSLQNWGLRRT